MKELNRTTKLIIAAIALFLVFVIGYVTMHRPSVTYRETAGEVVKSACDTTALVSPQMLKTIQDQAGKTLALIDIRNRDDFSKGHIENAVNIPLRELLDKGNVSLLKKLSKSHDQFILYGKDQLQASTPCLLLRQLGFTDCKVLQGGYDYYVNPPPDSLYKGQAAAYVAEISRIDTSLVSKPAVSEKTTSSASEEQKPKTVKPAKKAKSSGGGC